MNLLIACISYIWKFTVGCSLLGHVLYLGFFMHVNKGHLYCISHMNVLGRGGGDNMVSTLLVDVITPKMLLDLAGRISEARSSEIQDRHQWSFCAKKYYANIPYSLTQTEK